MLFTTSHKPERWAFVAALLYMIDAPVVHHWVLPPTVWGSPVAGVVTFSGQLLHVLLQDLSWVTCSVGEIGLEAVRSPKTLQP